MKKLKYSRFFFKKFIPSLIVALCICGISYLVYSENTKSRMDQFVQNVCNSTKYDLERCTDTYGMNEAAYRRALAANASSDYYLSYQEFDWAIALIDKDSGELVATSKMIYNFIITNTDNRPRNSFLCTTDELFDVYNKAYELGGTMVIREIYIDGDYFYPGRVDIVNSDKYYDGTATRDDIYESFDFTKDYYLDYEYYNGDSILLTLGTSRNSEALQYIEESIINGNSAYELDNGISVHEPFFLGPDDKNMKLRVVCKPIFLWSGGILVVAIWVVTAVTALIYSVASSISAYRKYYAQYEIDEYRRNMTSALAHDLKTPLTAIMGYSENLKSNVHSEKRDYYADAVIENVRYMNEIITGTLELAKIEKQDTKLNKTDIDMVALANELLAKYKADFEDRGISVSVSGNCTVKADRNLISRAVENLMSNAVKYTADGGRVEIIADDKCFSISNSCAADLKGSTEDFCKVFGKADTSRSNRSGVGIGLAMVHNIALLHKFRLDASASGGKFTAKIIFK
ncbi:MAG: HAMP domain-containing histidine kinase [Oscillospiraceae bacterium]|nr:HAMP domain-containing histidine kinase [Oscillospiraceae bacterium]